MTSPEAFDPQTPLARLQVLLSDAEQPHRGLAWQFPALPVEWLFDWFGSETEGRSPRIASATLQLLDPDEFSAEQQAAFVSLQRSVVDLECLASDVSRQELNSALASHPALTREEWLQALALSPRDAIRNRVFYELLDRDEPIIKCDADVFALAALAQSAGGTAADSLERRAVVRLIDAGLPQPSESYGMDFLDGEAFVWEQLCCSSVYWRLCDHWPLRSVLMHTAGRMIMHAVGGTSYDPEVMKRVRVACLSFCRLLTAKSDEERWWDDDHDGSDSEESEEHLVWVPYAPSGCDHFKYLLCVRYSIDEETWPVLGWISQDGAAWLTPRVPGFFPFVSVYMPIQTPADISNVLLQSPLTYTDAEDLDNDRLMIEVYDDRLHRIYVGMAGISGVMELSGVDVSQPLPKVERSRLKKLFGSDSDAARFGRRFSRGYCPDCGSFSLAIYESGCDCDPDILLLRDSDS